MCVCVCVCTVLSVYVSFSCMYVCMCLFPYYDTKMQFSLGGEEKKRASKVRGKMGVMPCIVSHSPQT